MTLGDALKIVLAPDARPERVAFFMPLAPGPCRFGQYAPFLRRVLDSVGATDAMIVSPSSAAGYGAFGAEMKGLQRAAWRALVVADLLRKALLRVRPYETERGAADAAHDAALGAVCAVLERPGRSGAETLSALKPVLARSAALFAAVPQRSEERLLVGVVGEIYCRLNTFSNEDLVRRLEEQGGEAWISDLTEWIYYTNLEQRRKWIPYAGERWSKQMLVAYLKEVYQRKRRARAHRALPCALPRPRGTGAHRRAHRPRRPLPPGRRGLRRDGAEHREGDLSLDRRAATASSM